MFRQVSASLLLVMVLNDAVGTIETSSVNTDRDDLSVQDEAFGSTYEDEDANKRRPEGEKKEPDHLPDELADGSDEVHGHKRVWLLVTMIVIRPLAGVKFLPLLVRRDVGQAILSGRQR